MSTPNRQGIPGAQSFEDRTAHMYILPTKVQTSNINKLVPYYAKTECYPFFYKHTYPLPSWYLPNTLWLAALNGPTNVENYLPGNVVGPITKAGPTCLVLPPFQNKTVVSILVGIKNNDRL
jgi:hypothetical protein